MDSSRVPSLLSGGMTAKGFSQSSRTIDCRPPPTSSHSNNTTRPSPRVLKHADTAPKLSSLLNQLNSAAAFDARKSVAVLTTDTDIILQKLGSVLPYTREAVLTHAKRELTSYEISTEIQNYDSIYFFSSLRYKSQRRRNHHVIRNTDGISFDDRAGNYNVVIHDHLAFRYEVLSTLGKGAFGQVLRCRDHKTNTDVAIKLIRSKDSLSDQAAIEIKILKLLYEESSNNSSHNVIQIKEHFVFRSHVCIVFVLLGKPLLSLVQKHKTIGINISLVRQFAIQLLHALKFIKTKRIIHADIKLENILLESTEDDSSSSRICLVDFGSSCLSGCTTYSYIQSRFYRAPEVLRLNHHHRASSNMYDHAIDMWSLGCVLAELCSGKVLFASKTTAGQYDCITSVIGNDKSANAEKLKNILGTCDAEFLDFLASCLCLDPAMRLRPTDGLRHAWVKPKRSSSTTPASLVKRRTAAKPFLRPERQKAPTHTAAAVEMRKNLKKDMETRKSTAVPMVLPEASTSFFTRMQRRLGKKKKKTSTAVVLLPIV